MPSFSPSGLTIDTTADILQAMKDAMQAPEAFGPNFSVEDTEPHMVLAAILAERERKLQEFIQEAFVGLDIDQAEGTALDNLTAFIGSKRKPETFSKVSALVSGKAGTDVSGKIVRYNPSGALWVVPSNSILPGGGTLEVVLNAQDPGPIDAVASNDWSIISLTPGFDAVISIGDADRGSYLEPDNDFRARYKKELAALGRTTEPAIVANLLQDVVNTTKVTIFPNRTNIPDKYGVPPHGMELLITGGDDLEIVKGIHDNVDPSSQTKGDIELSFVDEFGITQTQRFSRADLVAIAAEVILDTTGAEVPLPPDVVTIVKNAVKAYIDSFPPGKDVIPTALFLPILAALPPESVTSIQVLVGLLGDPLLPQILPVNNRQIPIIELIDITVTILP